MIDGGNAREDGGTCDTRPALHAAGGSTFAELTAAGYHGRGAPLLTDFDAWMRMVDDPDGSTVLVTAG